MDKRSESSLRRKPLKSFMINKLTLLFCNIGVSFLKDKSRLPNTHFSFSAVLIRIDEEAFQENENFSFKSFMKCWRFANLVPS